MNQKLNRRNKKRQEKDYYLARIKNQRKAKCKRNAKRRDARTNERNTRMIEKECEKDEKSVKRQRFWRDNKY